MNKELIQKLVEHAKAAADNAYCPSTHTPEGASLLVEGNIIVSGCNIEFAFDIHTAGEVVLTKAFSEGMTNFIAICFWSKNILPFPTGKFLQIASEFNPGLDIIVANDTTYSLHKLHDLLPYRRIISEE
ncbi:MAG: cytidine deaminase [Firmicutes bacterium]|nr:cytidine deaminase [Bacillota bacterium]